ncbi:MAG: ATP-dependent 6-phosphofructokinase [bacterium]|nr:ATP-dependent 6-phosphofructokinase [bacterium]
MVLTGGGDCPGLNAVIRGVVKRASQNPEWEIVGSIQSYNGMLWDPMEYRILDSKAVSGIHVQGGTIIETVNRGGPFTWPTQQPDGSWIGVDRSDELIENMKKIGIEAVISIGGDGSQRISQQLFEKGVNVIGVPKTIDNDLSSTDYTFGFQTAVEIATDAIDKLVTTATSHNRVMLLEVMGRYAGWIALYAGIAGGADICLIPEIPFDINKVRDKIEARFTNGRGFAIIIAAEGAHDIVGDTVAKASKEVGYYNPMLGGIAMKVMDDLKTIGVKHDMRATVLGHIQRGGTPNAYDRIMATEFGVRAFEMILEKKFGHMVAYRHPEIVTVPIKEAIAHYKVINPERSSKIRTAKGIGISFGD